MNAASWVILVIVVAIVGLAVKATFFKKKRTGGCCDTGDPLKPAAGDPLLCEHASSGCNGCTACSGAAARNTLRPTYREKQ